MIVYVIFMWVKFTNMCFLLISEIKINKRWWKIYVEAYDEISRSKSWIIACINVIFTKMTGINTFNVVNSI